MGHPAKHLASAATNLAAELPPEVVEVAAEVLLAAADLAAAKRGIAERVAHPQFRRTIGTFVAKLEGSLAPAAVGAALLTAAVSQQASRARQEVEVVWSGPHSEAVAFRRTEQAILQVLDSASQRITLVSYAVYAIPRIRESLVRAAKRGVRITVILETPDRMSGQGTYDTLRAMGAEVAACSSVYYWPEEKRPKDDGKNGHSPREVRGGRRALAFRLERQPHRVRVHDQHGTGRPHDRWPIAEAGRGAVRLARCCWVPGAGLGLTPLFTSGREIRHHGEAMASKEQAHASGAAPRRKKRSPHVPGQFLGYSLQASRAVVRLLSAPPGSSVSIEVFDDVGVQLADGQSTAEQTKSATASNPIADRSVELWKTLANWVEAVESGGISLPVTTFELYVSKKKKGNLAEVFDSAVDEAAARAALNLAKVQLWGPPPEHPQRAKVSATLQPHLDRVFGADEKLVVGVIQRFSLAFGRGDITAEVQAELRSKLVSDDMLAPVGERMIGWAKTRIDSLLEQRRAAVLATDDFAKELLTFVRKYDRSKILYSFAGEPSQEAVAAELPVRRYIRQLDIIDIDFEGKLRAANDFLRASVDRSVWADKGLVNSTSFDDFEQCLVRTWEAKRLAVSVQAADKPEPDMGRLLYAECLACQHQLEGLSVPPHFTPGCFHELADAPRLGWHPRYREEITPRPTTNPSPAES